MAHAYTLKIQSTGIVNGTRFTGTGDGHCDSATGRIGFRVTYSDFPANADPFANLLGTLIIPTVFGLETKGAHNLLSLCEGNFHFSQTMAGDDISLHSHGSMSRTGKSELLWQSAASGKLSIPAVTQIDTFSAMMLPQGLGRFVDVIDIPLIADGRRRSVHALRHFTFAPRAGLDRPQLRAISVTPKVQGKTVEVDITSVISCFPLPPAGS